MVDPQLALIFTIVLTAYFLPTIVATIRCHRQQHAICALNMLMGWTMLGWIIALIWAFVRSGDARRHA